MFVDQGAVHPVTPTTSDVYVCPFFVPIA
jgi:hypothetical protein